MSVETSRDIIERERAERALRESEDRLRMAASAARLGVYEWSVPEDRTRWENDRMYEIFGRTREQGPLDQAGFFREALLPDDRPIVARAVRRAMRDGQLFQLECRIRHGASGEIRWLENSGRFEIGPDGRPTRLVGVVADITDRKRIEESLRESEERFRTLADNIPQLAWIADETGAIAWVNKRWVDFTGLPIDEVKGWGWRRTHHPAHLDRVVDKLSRHFASGEPWEDTFPMRSATGEYRWFLSRAFPIRDRYGNVIRWFGTNTDVTAQRAAEQALREAAQRKDEFIAILAHELRNPLAPIRNAVELLRRLGGTDPAVSRARDVIDRQVTHMARLIDDLLDVSRISQGRLKLHKERCDLGEIVRQISEDYRATVEKSGLALTVTVPREPLWVEGDPVRLAQMVGNLLQNAYRFTPRGGRVDVAVERSALGNTAAVRIVDSGVGLDPSLLSRLFAPFAQADQGLARQKGGLGLGLALTKGLVELHGGTVEATSEGPGRGATFTLILPTEEVLGAPVTAREEVANDQGLRILVVEDNRDSAETLGELLELIGHQVELAFDGVSGVRAARQQRPDVVISDIGLPGELDGYGVARALREDPTLEGVPLIALSGYADQETRKRARDAGFDGYVAKPATLQALETALHEATHE